jgi:hypothetical protein
VLGTHNPFVLTTKPPQTKRLAILGVFGGSTLASSLKQTDFPVNSSEAILSSVLAACRADSFLATVDPFDLFRFFSELSKPCSATCSCPAFQPDG